MSSGRVLANAESIYISESTKRLEKVLSKGLQRS